jgi:hypothetical protein
MNASARPFVNGLKGVLVARLALCAGASALLSACVGNPFATAPVDPASPIAAEIAKRARTVGPYPTFAQIPPMPKDVRAPPAYGAGARKLEAAGAELDAQTAPDTWTLGGTDTFATGAQSTIGKEQPVTPADAGTEAFVSAGQKRATPPPPHK